MIPRGILGYLRRNDIPFEQLAHEETFTASDLAARLHVTGHRVAKPVLVEVAGETWMAVLPASEQVDPIQLGEAIGHGPVRLMNEDEFRDLFPDCEPGAEPPLGGKYGLPVVVDRSLEGADFIVAQAGSHRDALRMRYRDWAWLEHPWRASFGVAPQQARVKTAELRP